MFTVMEMLDRRQILVFVRDNRVRSMIRELVGMLSLRIQVIYTKLMYNPYRSRRI